MSTPLTVTAVIPTFNYGRFLGEAIESVLAQTYPALEIIVVDDGSTDDTAAVAAHYRDRIRYERTPNRGVSAARNFAVSIARGDLIALLDADDRWLPHKLERQIPLFAANPDLGMVHTGSRIFDHETGAVLCEVMPDESMDFHDILTWCSISLPSAVIPRRVFAELGGFDEHFGSAADWEMWIRIATKYQLHGCREILVEYRIHGRNMSGRAIEHYEDCMAVLDKSSKIHPGCAHCRIALNSARHRVREIFYDKSSAVARDYLRKGQYFQGLAWRCRSVWRYPKILLQAPTIVQNRLGLRPAGSTR